jgi:Flp pilus assembly protein TadD
MSIDAPHPQLLRGLQLKELGRYTDAESAFKEALAQEPNDAFALHQLAGCQWQIPGRHKDALSSINQAIAVEPNEPEHHVLRGFILCVLDRPKEALAAARTALSLDPNDSSAFAAEAQAHLQSEQWALAETSARQALALDADNSAAANQLAQALRLQNKQAENAAHLAGMLARDPDDAFTHANAGWAALQRGQHREAETHFREALRLDPDFDYAREGLLNSFRARSPLYRAYLKYSFAMARLSSGARWAVILGLYFGMQVATRFPGGIVFVALYFMFVLWVWVARPVGNFLLLFDAFAKYALRPREKIEAAVVGGGLCLGVASVIVSFALRASSLEYVSGTALFVGLGCIASSFPLSMTFTNQSRAGVWIFGAIGGTTLLAMVVIVLALWLPAFPEQKGVTEFFMWTCLTCLASTWLGNIPALNKRG